MFRDRLYQFLSYIWPIVVERKKNALHTLEVEWNNGVLMLNSSEANYSFGNLHEVFLQVFKDSDLQISTSGEVLLLGLGGGSVISILERHYGFEGTITAVDFDADIIALFQKYFNDRRQSNVQLIHDDALNFIMNHRPLKYDLIVIDLFLDLSIPEFLHKKHFYSALLNHLNPRGTVYLNTVYSDRSATLPFDLFYPLFKSVRKFEYFEMNRVFELNAP